jgi:hypothetical protein
VKFEQVEETHVTLQTAIQHHLFLVDADITVHTGLRPNHTVPSVYCIEHNSPNRNLPIKYLFLLLGLLTLALKGERFIRVVLVDGLGPDGSVEQEDMRKQIFEHITEVLDVVLVGKALFRVQVFHPSLG